MFKRCIKSLSKDITFYCSISVTSVRCLLVGLSVILRAVNNSLSKVECFGTASAVDGPGVEEAHVEEVAIDAGVVGIFDMISAAFALCTIMAVYFSVSPDPRFPIIFFTKQVRMVFSIACSIAM